METVFNTGVNPVHSGVYIVDRGEKLGTPLRWFDADTGVWSRCEYTMEDILKSKDKPGALGFLPWRGPIKVVAPKVQPVTEVALVNTTDIQVTPKTKPAKVPKVKAVKVAKAPKVKTTKATHADGTITFREDRQKYMAWHGGKPIAARPTIESAKNFLIKKGIIAENIIVIV
jgi:hypothetical protein